MKDNHKHSDSQHSDEHDDHSHDDHHSHDEHSHNNHAHEHGEGQHRDHGDVHSHGDHHSHGAHDHSHDTGLLAKLKHALLPHAHDHADKIQSAEESSKEGIRTAWIGLAGMMATAIAQVVIVAISGSVALLADTIHNIGHAITTIPLVIAFQLGRKRPTKRYNYGYRRVEDLVGLFIGLIILVSVGYIFYEAIDALINPRDLNNLAWVFSAGIVGFLGNEMVAIYRIRAGKRINSATLIAEGQHARTDGLSSIGVVIGVVGIWLGFEQADAIMGFLIGLLVFGILVASMRPVFSRMLDGVEDGLTERLITVAKATPGVKSVDRVRARWAGHRMECDLSIQVDSNLNVLEAHAIAEATEHALLHAVPNMNGVVVHLHPTVNQTTLKHIHELSGHHASQKAREAYLARTSSSN